MSGERPAKFSRTVAIWLMVVAVPGFIATLVLNAFFLDDYDAYGEVPIPGSASLHLPQGEVTVSLHTVVIGGPNGGGLPVPPLGVTIDPPSGVAQPAVTENFGSTTTANNDAHVRVWVAQVPSEGNYNITTDGKVNGYIDPRLAFGHGSSIGFLVWVFVGLFVVGLIGSIVASKWLGRVRRNAVPAAGAGTLSYEFPVAPLPPIAKPTVNTVVHEPSGEGVRLERLKTIAALHDSGALTDAEFEAEKRRILDGD
ncbi:MAG: SHOCT domain-containing protein [Mycobacterium sp.]|uniref:SHOCT domain-containing protein n=2 Tax=Mycobacterium sp. TaxID=1785 RepID=UPI003C342EE0